MTPIFHFNISRLRRMAAVFLPALAVFFLRGMVTAQPAFPEDALGWPEATRECRPWTRWWWMGSAVDATNLTRLLTEYKAAGLGGVEICPIYGAKGYENRFIDFLSPKWMEMLEHTTAEAARLDLGVDMTTGTGWPFGGPRVTTADASAKVILNRYEVAGGQKFSDSLPGGQLECLMAISENMIQTNLTAQVRDGRLAWTAPPGKWRLYAVSASGPAQQVKRSAPGGEGNVLDPYSTAALGRYLADFDQAFAGYHGAMPRCQFHDSFEYYGAQWTPELFTAFAARRGYDLRSQLPALFGEGKEDTIARVQGDYRETISDLHLAYIQRWTEWAHGHGSLSRDQAHGSPGNLLDIYAASDIPETEIFGAVSEQGIPLNKFSSSAAHLSGRKLASSESFTWLNEHFQASFSQIKQAADYLFLTGVNHILFHGIPYSPAGAAWPGWQFYAAVNFGPDGGLWHDLPEFAAYVTRCQSVLQSGASANDVLLYYPVYDAWQTPGKLLIQNPLPRAFTNAALALWERGYAFDHLSDRFLAKAQCVDGRVMLGGTAYRAVVVPQCSRMPEATLAKLVELASAGATILFQDKLPQDVPGLGDLEKRRAQFLKVRDEIKPADSPSAGMQRAVLGKGAMWLGADLDGLFRAAEVPREPCVDQGIRFVRRKWDNGNNYFLANRGDRAVDGWVALATPAKSAVILDPQFEHRSGVAALRKNGEGAAEIYLQLQPGESCLVRTFAEKTPEGAAWQYYQSAGAPMAVNGSWKVEFISGGPELPRNFETTTLPSWTALDDAEGKRFAGTARYTIEFDCPPGEADDWLLDLGRVCESARVKINGREAGAFWCAPFAARANHLLHSGKNTLEVEVTNLAANRIADMDRRKVNWKYFYNANLASHYGGSLDASKWKPFDSGLLGPVTLRPLKNLSPSTTLTRR